MRQEIDPSKSFRNDGHATWQFTHDMRPGDIVFVKQGLHKIIGRGVVESGYDYDRNLGEYCSFRRVRWTHHDQHHHEHLPPQPDHQDLQRDHQQDGIQVVEDGEHLDFSGRSSSSAARGRRAS